MMNSPQQLSNVFTPVGYGQFYALSYEISRGGKHVSVWGSYSNEMVSENEEAVALLRQRSIQLGLGLDFFPTSEGDRQYLVLYKYEWARDAAIWLYTGPGSFHSLNQQQRDWMFGLLFGYGGSEIHQFYDNRVVSGWYANRQADYSIS